VAESSCVIFREEQPEESSVLRLRLGRFFMSVWMYRTIRVALSGIFLLSGVIKLFNPASFAAIIDAYGLIPESWVILVSMALPALELGAGIGLLIDIRGSLATVTGLLILFAFILGYGIWMGLDVDCGCFGPGDPEGEAYQGIRPALYRDLAMIAGAGCLYAWRYMHAFTPPRIPDWFKEY
jgi:hypothetical protein